MQVSFDLMDQHECETAQRLIATVHPELAPNAIEAPNVPNAPEPVADSVEPVSPTATPNGIDPTAGVELDANGTPWIADVHAGTKSQTKDGVWKAKRGVDKDVIASTEAAARAKIAGTPQPTAPTEPVVPPTEVPQEPVTMADVSVAWTDAVNAGLVTNEGAMALYAQIGVDPAQLNVNETMRATLVNHLRSMSPGIPGVPGA